MLILQHFLIVVCNTTQVIGWKDCLQNDPLGVDWDVKYYTGSRSEIDVFLMQSAALTQDRCCLMYVCVYTSDVDWKLTVIVTCPTSCTALIVVAETNA